VPAYFRDANGQALSYVSFEKEPGAGAPYWKAGQSIFRTCWPIPNTERRAIRNWQDTEVPSACHSCATEVMGPTGEQGERLIGRLINPRRDAIWRCPVLIGLGNFSDRLRRIYVSQEEGSSQARPPSLPISA
jgi:hypothetical protein